MQNEILDFYEKHEISPVHADENDYLLRVKKRRNLYRQLGVPVQALKGSRVIEFGTGGGYNALLLLQEFGCAHIDLVEPNMTGRKEIVELFMQYGIDDDLYTIHSDTIEEYHTDHTYDIIIAEQFFHTFDNWKQCLDILKGLGHKDSIIIFTCGSEIGLYVEAMKRMVARYYIKDIVSYDEKVNVLCNLFEGQLKNMQYMSRPVKDWVEDQILCTSDYSGHLMNLKEAISEYKTDFDILGTSQNIFTDWSWYKEYDYDYFAEYERQYDEKKHLFLTAGYVKEYSRSIEDNNKLEEAVINANRTAWRIEEGKCTDINELLEAVEKVSEATDNCIVKEFNLDLRGIVLALEKGEKVDIDNYPNFNKVFGKSSQYISFVKK